MIPNESKLRKSNNLLHLLRRRNFSFFALYLVANSLVAEIACCKKSLGTTWEFTCRSLLVV